MDLSAKQLRRFRSNMQMVFQDAYSSLDPRLTIADSVAEPMLVHGSLTRAEQRQRSADLLERVGLEASFLDRRPRELSGGQLQRIAIARALSVRPKVIICDEPVSALDVSIRAQVLNLLLSLKQEFAVTYLVITHDLALIPVIADHVLVMRAGEVVERGTSTEVMLRPQHPYTKELLGSIPSLVPKALRPDRASHAAVTAPPPSLDPPSAPQSPPHPAHDSTGEADR